MKRRVSDGIENDATTVEPQQLADTGESDIHIEAPQVLELNESTSGETETQSVLAVEPPIISECELVELEPGDDQAKTTPQIVVSEETMQAIVGAFNVLRNGFSEIVRVFLEVAKSEEFQRLLKAVDAESDDATADESPQDEPPIEQKPKTETTVTQDQEPKPQLQPQMLFGVEPETEPEPKPEQEPVSESTAITDGTPLADTGILEGINRFGEQRKKAVLEECPTVEALQAKIASPGGLTKIEGVGKSIAKQIVDNLHNWLVATGRNGDDAESGGDDGDNNADAKDANNSSESDPGEPAANEPSETPNEPQQRDAGDTGGTNNTGDDPLAGLTLLDTEPDEQVAKSRQILADLVTRYRQHGPDGFEVESQYQQYFERGRDDAGNGIPGDDCIYTDADRAKVWAWGWVTRTLDGADEE